ncbi:MAG TPA: alpha/beta hydrolase [Acidimicrobiia bacterium]|nr:alpha/beta hydrolase [Acidimicrobiia bacterium]
MARRSVRGLAALLIALALTACATEDGSPSTTAPTTTTLPSTTTTAVPTTSSTVPVPTSTTGDPFEEVDAEITVPDGEGPFPAVVLLHGGGWVAGAPGLVAPLASHLTENEFLVVNTRYTLASFDRAGFPDAVEDVACAVRYAATHPESDGTVAVIGHSAGAHLGALVSLVGDRYPGDCPFEGSGLPEKFVGLAGPYDVSRLGLAIAAFFGGAPDRVPDVWEAGNPMNFVGENPDLEALIMYGELDGLVADSFALGFHAALLDAGAGSVVELVEGARHNDMHDPDLVGDLIVTWLEK